MSECVLDDKIVLRQDAPIDVAKNYMYSVCTRDSVQAIDKRIGIDRGQPSGTITVQCVCIQTHIPPLVFTFRSRSPLAMYRVRQRTQLVVDWRTIRRLVWSSTF